MKRPFLRSNSTSVAPTGIDISLTGEASATAGVEVNAYDLSLVDFSSKVLDASFDIYSTKVLDTSGVTVGVK